VLSLRQLLEAPPEACQRSTAATQIPRPGAHPFWV